jgi:hypothetical protein
MTRPLEVLSKDKGEDGKTATGDSEVCVGMIRLWDPELDREGSCSVDLVNSWSGEAGNSVAESIGGKEMETDSSGAEILARSG